MTDDGPNLKALRTWAQARGLEVSTSKGTQREPENVVSISDEGRVLLMTKQSLDSIDTAAMYLINVIDRLQEDPHEP